MQTVTTYYLCPTNFRGSRIKAITSGKSSVVLDWDDSLNSDENHVLALKAICKKLNWTVRTWSIGHLHDGSTVFVNASDTITID